MEPIKTTPKYYNESMKQAIYKYREKNREKINESNKKIGARYYTKNKEEILKKRIAKYKENDKMKIKTREINRLRYQNSDAIKEQRKNYYQTKKEFKIFLNILL